MVSEFIAHQALPMIVSLCQTHILIMWVDVCAFVEKKKRKDDLVYNILKYQRKEHSLCHKLQIRICL